jgi:hypothetical protein
VCATCHPALSSRSRRLVDVVHADTVVIDDLEREFGNFAPGRYAWKFADVRAIAPIPHRGFPGACGTFPTRRWPPCRCLSAVPSDPRASRRRAQKPGAVVSTEEGRRDLVTCIVGLVDGDKVWIGGDSAGVGGYDLTVRADEKVFRNGPMLFGFTTSFRMGQLLRYALTIPDHDPRAPIEKYMATTFVDAVRTCLKDHGWASKKYDSEEGGQFLVGYRGHLFYIGSDYQIGRSLDGFDAVGCGADVARGALFATPDLPAKVRLETALSAAERCSAGVRGPFHILAAEAGMTATPDLSVPA